MATAKALLQGVWRRALNDEAGVTIPCGTVSDARKMRFALYNSMKDARGDNPRADEELVLAAQECSITFKDDEKGFATIVLVQNKANSELLKVLGRILADTPELVKTSEEVAVAASLEKIQGLLDKQPEQETRSTPYYTRERGE